MLWALIITDHITSRKEEFSVLIIGLDAAGKTVRLDAVTNPRLLTHIA
jgi:hypothetical protein